MKFSRLVSTIILVTTFACIFLFVCIFWFYSNADSKTLGLLKDSLSTASGFFGGITTLIAAYIGSKLFNDWKHQHNIEIRADSAKEIMKLHEDVFYDMLTLDKFYKKAQFDLSKIKIDTTNDQIKNEMTEIYRQLESSINSTLLGVEEKLNWIVLKTSTLTILINEAELLAITLKTQEDVSKLMQPLRDQKDKTMSNLEFDKIYEEICENSIKLATNTV